MGKGRIIILSDEEEGVKVVDGTLRIKKKIGKGQYHVEKIALQLIKNVKIFNKKSLEIETEEEARRFKLLLNFPDEERAKEAEKKLLEELKNLKNNKNNKER